MTVARPSRRSGLRYLNSTSLMTRRSPGRSISRLHEFSWKRCRIFGEKVFPSAKMTTMSYFDRRTAHGHAQLAEPPFPPTDVDPFTLHFEIGIPLTQELPAA